MRYDIIDISTDNERQKTVMTNYTTEQLLEMKTELSLELDLLSAILNKYPKNEMGLIDDKFKTNDYYGVKKQYETAFALYRDFNAKHQNNKALKKAQLKQRYAKI